MNNIDWSIPGADGEMILGNTQFPKSDSPGAVAIICHGFKGYKDYGFIPYLTQQMAKHGIVAHRFNFSHSGMTNHLDTFERPDLFEKDSWSRQIHDLQAVSKAIRDNHLAGADLPMIWFGHSRGGITSLLAAAHTYQNKQLVQPSGLIIAASPCTTDTLDADQKKALRHFGYLESPSARTGQMLRIGRTALDEIESDPDGFDPLRAIRQIHIPILILHGDDDETVPVEAAYHYAQAAEIRGQLHIIAQANHVFNGQNPLPTDIPPPAQLEQMIQAACDFTLTVSRPSRGHTS